MFRRIQPEVAGQLGQLTVWKSTYPAVIEKLNYEFDGWSGDDILESFPCYIVTERLKDEIYKAELTGICFDHVTITKSGFFLDLYPDRALPEFYWAKIKGKKNIDDFSLDDEFILLVSPKAYRLLTLFNIQSALIGDNH